MNVVDLVNAKIGDLHREPGLEPNDRSPSDAHGEVIDCDRFPQAEKE